MGKLFYLKGVDTWINPMQISSIYRAADSRHVTMANGSDYTVAEDEYVGLIDAFNQPPMNRHDGDDKHGGKEFFEKMKKMFEDALNDKQE